MPRRKKTSAPDVAKAIATSADPIKAGNRSRLAMKRAGLENIKQAFKLYDIEERFANVYAAVGFAGSIAAQPFSAKHIYEFETIGRARLAALGVVETADDIGDRTEVIVSVPITQQDALTALYALGLKRTGMSTSRGYVELRGAAAIETLKPLVAEMEGVVTTVERPASILPKPQSATDAPEPHVLTADADSLEVLIADSDGQRTASGEPAHPARTAAAEPSSNESASRSDEPVQPAAAPPESRPSRLSQQGNHGVPPYVRRKLEEFAARLPTVAPAAQPKSMPEVIARVLNEPTRSIRPPFRPPLPDALLRRTDQ